MSLVKSLDMKTTSLSRDLIGESNVIIYSIREKQVNFRLQKEIYQQGRQDQRSEHLNMEEFKAKTNKVRHEIDQAEEREKSAVKKLVFANHEADEKEKEVDALKRRLRLLEDKVFSVQDRIIDKENAYQEELARNERESRQIKILYELEDDDERKMEKLQASIKQYEKSADYSENKCAECWRRLQTVTRETERFRVRFREATEKRNELEEQNKFVGRNLRKLAISEEKRGDREDACENKIRELWHRRRDEEIRCEGAERTIGRLESQMCELKNKISEEQEKIYEVKSTMDEAMNGLGRF